ncbi:hypothetical protein [Winogradskyella sp. SYSU M77433]|uniref:hypothetical protein n=1 Tax=Winogradskyella sp. SYSU M77433 TaxID=3042722 RepID=UPI0024818C8B|nr:hypothetical protein [Winogradskyella sp. SYSU M77433]MDH7913335.1 hypothetical protein [Winogradskyella sp. SYSU M77433]
MAFNSLVSTLEVESMDKTIAFYESFLDFKCISRDANNWAFLKKDDVEIMLSYVFTKINFQNPFLLVDCTSMWMILM